MAQWIEHLTSNQRVAGSSLPGVLAVPPEVAIVGSQRSLVAFCYICVYKESRKIELVGIYLSQPIPPHSFR